MKKRRGTVAKTIALRYAALLFVVLTIIALASYALVYSYALDNARLYSEAATDIYGTILILKSREQGFALTVENADLIQQSGEYMCRTYAVDYVYVYVPVEDGVRYIDLSCSKEQESAQRELADEFAKLGRIEPGNTHLHGMKIDYEMTPEELAMWNGEEYYANITMENDFGHELCTISRVTDDFGNAVCVGVDISYASMLNKVTHQYGVLMIMIFGVFAAVTAGLYLIIRKRVLAPAEKISTAMEDFISNGKRSDVKLNVATDDEFGMIAGAYNTMTREIDHYVENIGELRSMEEKQKAEMEVTAKIQKGFLPDGSFADEHYEIRGIMTPAKQIGGDLFDYVRLKDGRLFCVVADVSGKGVSAAMFMSTTLTALRELAKANVEPSVILRETNRILCENNAEGLFVTAFLAFYDPKEQTLTYSNAGHNLPYLLSGKPIPLSDAHGVVLGLFEGETYEQQTIRMRPGDTLFLYTDGVSEAVNEKKEFFGEARLEACLHDGLETDDPDLIGRVERTLRAFAGEAEQSDDVTMLTLSVRERKELLLDVDVREFVKIRDAILGCSVPAPVARAMCLSAEELFVNVVSYAFEGGVPDGEKIRFVLERSDRLKLTLEDGGTPYDPLAEVVSADEYDMDEQVGGLGKLISFGIADESHYEYQNGKNRVTILKYLEELGHDD